ncbi:MAG: DNA recombination protein RmuC [Candidatus Cloacimonadales bacterium]
MQNVIFSLILLVIGIATGLFIQRLKSNSQLSLLEIKLKEEQKQEHELKLTEVNNQLRSRELEAEGLKKDIQHFSTLKGDLGKLQQEANVLLEENAILRTKETENRRHYEEKLAILTDAKESLKKDFELLANKIFEDKSTKFKETNQENISHLLNPMKTQLEEFRKRVDQVYDSENKDRASLKSEIVNLRTLNETLNKEAMNLTNALKRDPKKQGNWGEMKLERVLEDSGLDKNIEYFTQAHYTDLENNNRYPDVVIKLPEERDIIVDAKTSLTAYERFVSSETDSQKDVALKEHLTSIKKHISELSIKEYQKLDGINTVSHVLMFIPIESAYLLALENDNQMFVEAMDKDVMIVGPSTLIYVLRMIKQIWRSEYQTRNVLEIAEEGGKMYDKLCGFVLDLEKIGKNISDLTKSYELSMNKLNTGTGHLIGRAEKMKELGAKAKKQLTISSVDKDNDDKSDKGEE